MIFDLTKRFVPEVYSSSRDYRVFLRLLGELCTVLKYNTDHLLELYSAEDCPEVLLELLADMVGYEYDAGLPVSANRAVIKYFPHLIRNRGSELGMKLAVILSLNTTNDFSKILPMDDLVVRYDYESGETQVYYPFTSAVRKSLVEVVRPVGTTVELIPSDLGEVTDEIDIKVVAKGYESDYSDRRETIGKYQVGFGNTGSNRSNSEEDES